MKKFIAIACILVMCLGIMAGCMEKVEDTIDPNALVGVTLVYGETKIEVNAGQWEPKRTQIKTVDLSLPGTTKEYEFTGVSLASLMEIAGVTECSNIMVKSSDGWSAEVSPRMQRHTTS